MLLGQHVGVFLAGDGARVVQALDLGQVFGVAVWHAVLLVFEFGQAGLVGLVLLDPGGAGFALNLGPGSSVTDVAALEFVLRLFGGAQLLHQQIGLVGFAFQVDVLWGDGQAVLQLGQFALGFTQAPSERGGFLCVGLKRLRQQVEVGVELERAQAQKVEGAIEGVG